MSASAAPADSAPDGLELRLVCKGALAGTAEAVGAGELVWGAVFPCGGNVPAEAESAGACLVTGAEPAWTSLDCWRKYQTPPPANSRAPAAIAAIQRALGDFRELLSTASSLASILSSPPKFGIGNSDAYSSSTAPDSEGISSPEGCSATRLAFSRSTSSCIEDGAAALRARGSSQDGIFNSSTSREAFVDSGAIFGGSATRAGNGAGSNLANSKTFAAASTGFAFSVTGAPGRFSSGFVAGASMKSRLESCSCKRAACCFSAAVS